MLKLMNGLLMPDEGAVCVEGKNIAETDIISLRRRIGYVIQNRGLFPHMTVEKNITYVPVISGRKDKKENRELALRLLKLVGLEEEKLENIRRSFPGVSSSGLALPGSGCRPQNSSYG